MTILRDATTILTEGDSEKLFNVIFSRSIPIYYGDTSRLEEYGLIMDGILTFDNLSQLETIIEEVRASGNEIYESQKQVLEANKAAVVEARTRQINAFFRLALLPMMLKSDMVRIPHGDDWMRYFNHAEIGSNDE